jgi:hypothetical protein
MGYGDIDDTCPPQNESSNLRSNLEFVCVYFIVASGDNKLLMGISMIYHVLIDSDDWGQHTTEFVTVIDTHAAKNVVVPKMTRIHRPPLEKYGIVTDKPLLSLKFF